MKSGGCSICGCMEQSKLQLHHINKTEKIADINIVFKLGTKLFLDELKKCVVVCNECHKELHKNDPERQRKSKKVLQVC